MAAILRRDMNRSLGKLLEIAGPPLAGQFQTLPRDLLEFAGPLSIELVELLQLRNGFFAFESALHVFHSGASASEPSIEDWNAASLWRSHYAGTADQCLFFAEDAFGFQFCVRDDSIQFFDPECGRFQPLADSLESWAAQLLADYEYWTGFPLAHEWQLKNGRIPPANRLSPAIPFILGGEFKADLLHAIDSVELMRFRADLLRQTKHLPDGTTVRLRVKRE